MVTDEVLAKRSEMLYKLDSEVADVGSSAFSASEEEKITSLSFRIEVSH